MSNQEDEYKESLKIEIKNIKRCQERRGVDSCLKCDKLLECEIRAKYVQTVYESMSKGKIGGFEF